VLLNGGYSITGGQPLPAGDGTRLAPFARAARFAAVHEIDNADALRDALADVPGPTFLAVRVEPGYDRTATGEQTNSAQALRIQGGPGFHRLRAKLASSA
jgi:hypothetical protein